MRVMVINKANNETEAGVLPTQELLASMGALMEEMGKAGVLLAGDGLKASSHGVRVGLNGGKRTVTDGPFTETKELIAGFAIIKVNSMEEAVSWAQRMIDAAGGKIGPNEDFDIELRPLFESDDFGDAFTPELREAEDRLRAEIGRKS